MDRHRLIGSFGVAKDLFSLGRGSRVCGCGLMGVSVDKFDTDLFGEGELNLLAGGGSESGGALGDNDLRVDNIGNLDGTFLLDVSALNDGQADGFVDTGLLGGGVGNGDGDIDRGDNRDIVGGFLGDLLAVVVSVSSMSVSTISVVSGLADSDHLDLGFLHEGDLNGDGDGIFGGLFIRVGADFLGDDFDGFGTDGEGDSVGEVDIFDDLDGESDIFAVGLNGRGADLSDFSHINNGAVVFGFLITVTAMVSSISGGVVSVSGGGVSISGSWVVGGGLVIATIRGSGVSGAGQSEGEESQDCECLHVCCSACRVSRSSDPRTLR